MNNDEWGDTIRSIDDAALRQIKAELDRAYHYTVEANGHIAYNLGETNTYWINTNASRRGLSEVRGAVGEELERRGEGADYSP